MDLKDVHTQLLAEREVDIERARSNKEKGKHLLFLFQRDLLPGVSGKILESKGQRDNIAVKPVAWQAKAAGWTFICLLDVGMLFYILLFAVSQTVHRQGAWALSFVMWILVEILFVSSATVIFTHVLVPSLILDDVKKIKLKLADSIRAFNSSVRKRRGAQGADAEGPEAFNAASYLFVSTRLAQEWSDLREAQIIAQFRTPWPKQSYQRETDVSQGYSKKYTALYRSASVIAIFFLTNLLNIPPAFQDMVIHMTTTAAIGYTMLIHIDLYNVNPGLVIVPTVVICIAVHLFLQWGKARAKKRLEQLHPVDFLAPIDVAHDGKEESQSAQEEGAAKERAEAGIREPAEPSVEQEDDGSDVLGQLHLPASSALTTASVHITRKQSVVQGARVLHALRHEVDGAKQEEPSVGVDRVESFDSSVELSDLSDAEADGGVILPSRAAPSAVRAVDVSAGREPGQSVETPRDGDAPRRNDAVDGLVAEVKEGSILEFAQARSAGSEQHEVSLAATSAVAQGTSVPAAATITAAPAAWDKEKDDDESMYDSDEWAAEFGGSRASSDENTNKNNNNDEGRYIPGDGEKSVISPADKVPESAPASEGRKRSEGSSASSSGSSRSGSEGTEGGKGEPELRAPAVVAVVAEHGEEGDDGESGSDSSGDSSDSD
jgi:hypothetical protein